MEQLLMQMPWYCEDHGWHLSTYWTAADGGYTLDEFTDGDHEEVKEVPTTEEYEKAWEAYARDVLLTGEDRLGIYRVEYFRKGKQVWQIRVKNSILGLIVTKARRGCRGPWLDATALLPQAVLDFLNARPSRGGKLVIGDFDDMVTFRRALERDEATRVMRTVYGGGVVASGLTFRLKLEATEERSPEAIRRAIRRQARKDLSRD